LASDEKVFSKLTLEGYSLVLLPWITPLKNESIATYAKRMAEPIKEPLPIIIGLSFGGMISIEIAKLIPVKQLIIISSIKTKAELPLWMKLCGLLQLNKIVPLKQYKFLEPIQNKRLGVTNQEERALANYYRNNFSMPILHWSINQILNWQNATIAAPLTHIHGSIDKMFPIQKISNCIVIEGGGHFMIMNRAKEVSTEIKKAIENMN
jgi:pimeloyl-ACP methyl ester carboxylesterase